MDVRNYCTECDMPKPCECEEETPEQIAKRLIEDNIEVYKRLKDR